MNVLLYKFSLHRATDLNESSPCSFQFSMSVYVDILKLMLFAEGGPRTSYAS